MFQVSPGVNVSEVDSTSVVPSVATTEGVIAGVFNWGPVNERVLVTSETDLVSRFSTPTNDNAETFFTAADFLSYSNSLYVSRAVSNTAFNAGAANTQVLTEDSALAFTGANFIARYPGVLGNSLKVSVCPSANAYSSAVSGVTISTGANTATITTTGDLAAGDILHIGNDSIGYQDLTVSSVTGTDVEFLEKYRLASNTALVTTRYWGNYRSVETAPGANEIHVAVIDEDGLITGNAGTILEVYENVSVLSTAKTETGATNFYKTVINRGSNWLYSTADTITATGTATYTTLIEGTNGDDEKTIGLSALAAAYDLYISPEDVDVSLIMTGKSRLGTDGSGLANYLIDNIAEVRKDCVVFVSPEYTDVVNNPGGEVAAITAFTNAVSRSSYAFLDSGYKFRYDKYNDVYRYTPLNGDIAGLAARTDNVRDPWFSFAGYNRGTIKNIVKLAFNPNKAERDLLYGRGCNPVISQPGQGTLLFGDKTLLGRPSAFDRINVRRLFIVLEKAIARASKSTLFEFNDDFTRAQFRNLIEPFLRDVQGRRGIYDFRVVCDETNNTADVIGRNEFRGDIYIKPAKSINFIQLNFVAVRSGVEFEEIVGRV
jgi:phage tail sheath protein FI